MPPDAVIRPFDPSDADTLTLIFRRSVEGIGPKDYPPCAVAAWAGRSPSPERIRILYGDGRAAFVAVANGRIAAFGDVEPDGHIQFLYCDPDFAGCGLVSLLFRSLLAAGRDFGADRLHVEASEAARRFFLGKGFSVIERRDFEIDGVPIHNYAMARRLG